MKTACLALLVLLAAPAAIAADASTAASERAVERELPITPSNAIDYEAWWPYRVTLVAPVPVQALRVGHAGVLIRVLPGERARIDFGRDGIHTLPIAATDLVASANSLRLGRTTKLGPNLAVAIGPRLADSATAAPRLYGFETAAAKRGFLCVFVDGDAESLQALSRALAPLHDRHGVATVVLPQGQIPDLAMRERLRAAQWPVPFVLDHLSEAYTRTLLGTNAQVPAVSLQTAEGRVILEAAWSEELPQRIEAALDAEFARPSTRVESASSL